LALNVLREIELISPADRAQRKCALTLAPVFRRLAVDCRARHRGGVHAADPAMGAFAAAALE
jgi:hypothetical protein